MRVFLTGGTGFIGIPLTRALVRRGWHVTALVRTPDGPHARELARIGATSVRGDVLDVESMRGPMHGADIVIHNAGVYETGVVGAAKRRMYEVNVTATARVLGLAQDLEIRRTVYVSSTVATGNTGPELRDETYRRTADPTSWYEETKTEAHEIALRYQGRGLPLIIVCPNGVMGPNDHSTFGYFVRLYVNGLQPPVAWGAETITSHVHVDDLAEGIALAAEKGRAGETYLLAGESQSRRAMLAMWGEHPGGMRIRLFQPRWLTRLQFWPLEPLQRLAGIPAFASRESVDADVHLNYSPAKAVRDLGYRYRPAREMWASIMAEERALLAKRARRDLVSRLKPVAPGEAYKDLAARGG